eukprot:TRINITY_DN1326_c0_g1_i5.p1 TRINITY_DN1326_c0_g1~~TRINITY_DN1326_c0_g1_i5.p1  ORF type:complete len:212 (-),score=-2.80 TRINITY_DN1326_c0_g1_i5:40-675(-)
MSGKKFWRLRAYFNISVFLLKHVLENYSIKSNSYLSLYYSNQIQSMLQFTVSQNLKVIIIIIQCTKVSVVQRYNRDESIGVGSGGAGGGASPPNIVEVCLSPPNTYLIACYFHYKIITNSDNTSQLVVQIFRKITIKCEQFLYISFNQTFASLTNYKVDETSIFGKKKLFKNKKFPLAPVTRFISRNLIVIIGNFITYNKLASGKTRSYKI